MAKGFELELSDGTILQIVPNTGVSECSISHGDTKIEVDVTMSSFKTIAPSGKVIATIPTVVHFEPKDLTVGACAKPEQGDDQPHIMRSCMPCNGRWCCVTNACGNCGCGWICD